jgi:hypothetical protein
MFNVAAWGIVAGVTADLAAIERIVAVLDLQQDVANAASTAIPADDSVAVFILGPRPRMTGARPTRSIYLGA